MFQTSLQRSAPAVILGFVMAGLVTFVSACFPTRTASLRHLFTIVNGDDWPPRGFSPLVTAINVSLPLVHFTLTSSAAALAIEIMIGPLANRSARHGRILQRSASRGNTSREGPVPHRVPPLEALIEQRSLTSRRDDEEGFPNSRR